MIQRVQKDNERTRASNGWLCQSGTSVSCRRQLPSASAHEKHPNSFNLYGIVSATNIGGKIITPGYVVKLPIR